MPIKCECVSVVTVILCSEIRSKAVYSYEILQRIIFICRSNAALNV